MKNLLRYSGLGIATVLMVASCQQSSETVKPEPFVGGPKVSVINGRISLTSEEDFLATIKTLRKMSENERTAWDKSIGFTSLQEFYDQHPEGFELGTDNPVFKSKSGDKPYIGDFLAARLINEDGIMQIGNDVYTFKTEGKRLKTDAKSFDQTLKNDILSISDVSNYNVKLYNAVNLAPANTDAQAKGARVPDSPLVGTQVGFDGTHQALGFFSQSGIYPFYTSFALKYEMLEYGGWWIFKSWSKISADKLTIRNGHVRLHGNSYVNVVDAYNLEDYCIPCSQGEARAYIDSVNWDFAGGTVDQIQGVFNVTWDNNHGSYERWLP